MSAQQLRPYLGCPAWFQDGVLEIRPSSDAHLSVVRDSEVVLSMDGFARQVARDAGRPTEIVIPMSRIARISDLRAAGRTPPSPVRGPAAGDAPESKSAVAGAIEFIVLALLVAMVWQACN